MTILAGVFSRSDSACVPDSICELLRKNISRDPTDQRIEFRDAFAYLVKVDIGAFDRSAHCVSATRPIAMIAGEPLLTCDGPAGSGRDAHLEYLQTGLAHGSFEGLRSASGTFCAASYDPASKTAWLIADRLGLRPLYYTLVGNFVYFASALRILEALTEIPKKVDVVAVAEITGFGYPFGSATPYAGINMLLPCEIITLRKGEISSSRYFQWDAVTPLQTDRRRGDSRDVPVVPVGGTPTSSR